MKFIVAVTVLALVAVVYADDDWWPCTSDLQCEHDDCCIENRYANDGTKTCRDLAEGGRPCGGRYFCPCERPFICVPHAAATVNNPWLQGSNGTCQYPEGFQHRRRPYYYDSDEDRRR